jgi:hypothetical protein
MKFHSNYEEWPLSEEIGEARLRLDHARARHLVRLHGKEFTGGRYEAASIGIYPLRHDGEVRGVLVDLFALVPEYPGSPDPAGQRPVEIGHVAAKYYVEDRALAIQTLAAARLDEEDQIEFWMVFERYAQRHDVLTALSVSYHDDPGFGACRTQALENLGGRLSREFRAHDHGVRVSRLRYPRRLPRARHVPDESHTLLLQGCAHIRPAEVPRPEEQNRGSLVAPRPFSLVHLPSLSM